MRICSLKLIIHAQSRFTTTLEIHSPSFELYVFANFACFIQLNVHLISITFRDSIPGQSIIVVAGIDIFGYKVHHNDREVYPWLIRRLLDLRGIDNENVLFEASRDSNSDNYNRYQFFANAMDYRDPLMLQKLINSSFDNPLTKYGYFGIYYKPISTIKALDSSSNNFQHFEKDFMSVEQVDDFDGISLAVNFRVPNEFIFESDQYRPVIETATTHADIDKIVLLTNPFDCQSMLANFLSSYEMLICRAIFCYIVPFLPGIKCIFECGWGYQAKCQQTAEVREWYNPDTVHQYQIWMIKSSIGAYKNTCQCFKKCDFTNK